MSRLMLLSHVLTVVVSASYVTLAVAASETAEHLAVPYGLLAFVLAFVNVTGYWRVRHGRR